MNILDIKNRKNSGKKIAMLTCYDYSTALMLDAIGIDMLLVGDSLGMVMLGYDSTVPVSIDEMIHHSKAVVRGRKNALVIGDMPFGSYHVSTDDTIRNAVRFLKEAGCDAVKLEGGMQVAKTIERLAAIGIPVMAHIGLTPQTASSLGGYKVQGRDMASAKRLLKDAKAVADAGAFSVVLECVPATLARLITDTISIPTIGIGAGPYCDGQVLVTHDLLGIFEKFKPFFVKRYVNLNNTIKEAISTFIEEVRAGAFPDNEHSFSADIDFSQILNDNDE